MKLHERTLPLQTFEHELGAAVLNLVGVHKPTHIELAMALSAIQRHWLTYALRDERHPDAQGEKKADEA